MGKERNRPVGIGGVDADRPAEIIGEPVVPVESDGKDESAQSDTSDTTTIFHRIGVWVFGLVATGIYVAVWSAIFNTTIWKQPGMYIGGYLALWYIWRYAIVGKDQ